MANPVFVCRERDVACAEVPVGLRCETCQLGGKLYMAAPIAERRLAWLHSEASNRDAEGYEWGIFRVKWAHGDPVSVLHTNADFSDLDAEIERTDGVRAPVAVRVREVFPKGAGRWRYFDFDPTMDLNRPNEQVEVLFSDGVPGTSEGQAG